MDMWMELEQEGVDPVLLKEVRAFHDANPPDPAAAGRVPQPRFLYYGKQVWEAAAAALLCGENILLAGPKATGKNVLAENLAAAFGRPAWDVSLYVNVDAAALIGADTTAGRAGCLSRGTESASVHDRGASGFWTRSTWQKTRRWPCSTPRWTSGG